jgi:hypothetical protein
MSKKGKQNSPAEDYLAQVNWENDNQVDKRGHAPWKNTPNWKYKRAYGGSRGGVPLAVEILWWVFVISTIGYMSFQIFALHTGNGIFTSIVILALLAIPYFMTREIRNK